MCFVWCNLITGDTTLLETVFNKFSHGKIIFWSISEAIIIHGNLNGLHSYTELRAERDMQRDRGLNCSLLFT